MAAARFQDRVIPEGVALAKQKREIRHRSPVRQMVEAAKPTVLTVRYCA